MEALKDLMYAGLGLAKQTETQVKETFDVLVAKGKRTDEEGKNLVGDFFKTVENGTDTLQDKVNPILEKAEELIQKYKK
tara:strand:+ start:1734 stop:1970 length:237 start_codon:yes stop_codon:yes gene_type:complete